MLLLREDVEGINCVRVPPWLIREEIEEANQTLGTALPGGKIVFPRLVHLLMAGNNEGCPTPGCHVPDL